MAFEKNNKLPAKVKYCWQAEFRKKTVKTIGDGFTFNYDLPLFIWGYTSSNFENSTIFIIANPVSGKFLLTSYLDKISWDSQLEMFSIVGFLMKKGIFVPKLMLLIDGQIERTAKLYGGSIVWEFIDECNRLKYVWAALAQEEE